MTELLVVILIATSSDSSVDVMKTATRTALGENTVVRIEPTASPLSDVSALAIGRNLGATAIAKVQYREDAPNVARLHVHVDPSTVWLDEEIEFAEGDSPNERGRTVGYAVASMVARLERAQPPPALPPPLPLPPPPLSRHHTTHIDVFARLTVAVDGVVGGVGPAIGGRWWFLDRWGAQLTAGGRFGSISMPDMSVRTYLAGIGPSYRHIVGPFELVGRADVLAVGYVVTRTSGGVDTARERWVGALDLLFEADWTIGAWAVTGGIGGEVGWGPTAIRVGTVNAAEIPILRAVGELGARFRF